MLLWLVTLLLSSVLTTWAGQSAEDLKIRPLDTTDAENVRVWLSLERSNTCRVNVTIVNQAADTVRHFFSDMLSPGYYNYYWDKKDDSGQFVDPGRYRYIVHDCAEVKDGTLLVVYKEWERFSRLHVDQFPDSGVIAFELMRDSATVMLAFENRRGVVIDSAIVDSTMNQGHYRFRWKPNPAIPSGYYTVILRVGDFVHFDKIRFRK